MPSEEKMRMWLDNEENPEMQCGMLSSTHQDQAGSGLDVKDKTELPAMESYRKVVQSAAAYEKLLAAVRRECILATPELNLRDEIQKTIYSILPISRNISRNRQAQTFELTFNVDWHPFDFIYEQMYRDRPDIAIRNCIVFTGIRAAARALTCTQYLQQTWPVIGLDILNLIERGSLSPPFISPPPGIVS
ncbi:hypothetical protein BJX76DRAFT_94159 [Aspergillus varians]